MTDGYFSSLCQVLNDVQTVRTLHLNFIQMNERRYIDLGSVVSKSTSLVELKLRVQNRTVGTIQPFLDGLARNSTIRTLGLPVMHMTSEDLDNLLRALENNTTLTQLNLWANHNLKTNSSIARIATSTSMITSVNLSCVKFDQTSLDSIVLVLRENKSNLLELIVHNCEIDSENSVKIAEAICVNTKLTSLVFYSNYCDERGGMAMAKMLLVNSTLEKLDLERTNIGPDAGCVFYDALRQNVTLRSLNLDNNRLYGIDEDCLCDTLKDNTTLTELSTMDNDISVWYMDEMEPIISACMNRNKTLYDLTSIALSSIKDHEKSLKKQRIY